MENRVVFLRSSVMPRFAFCFLFLVISVCARSSSIEKIDIAVLAPNELRSKHDGAAANFGFPDNGAYMIGSVIYPEKGALGCQPFEGEKPFKSKPSLPTILLLHRGECRFAMKVWHAQLAGAAAVLVMDDKDKPLLTLASPVRTNSGDGFLEKINIPSALVTKHFGDKLKQASRNGDYVVLKIDWNDPKSLYDI